MSEAENSWLRRFLPQRLQPRPERPARSAATMRSRQQDARYAADVFAREAVVALYQLEQSFPDSDPDAASRVGARFGEVWDEAGLGDLDWTSPDHGDADRILAGAAELANDPSGAVTLDEAWLRAGTFGEPVVERAGDMHAEMEQAYGASMPDQDPEVWLRESLGRLQQARVIEDLVSQDTKVKVSPAVEQSMDEALEQAQRHSAARRSVGHAAKAAAATSQDATKAQRSLERTSSTAAGFVGVVAFAANLGTVASLSTLPPFIYLANQLNKRWERADSAWRADAHTQGWLVSRQQNLGAARDGLSGALDRATLPPGQRGGREQPGGGRRSGGRSGR